MELGAITLWGSDTDAYRQQVRLCAELGYDSIGIGDSPSGWRDVGVSLAIAAEEAPGTTISTMVTAPYMRHPMNTVNLMSTLNGLNGCKSVLGFATGGTNVMAMGRKPASIAHMRRHINTLRAMMAGEPSEWDGLPVAPVKYATSVPILLSALGPKALALAGEVADGAILFTGDRDEELDALEQRMEIVRESARSHGRDPDALTFWVCGYTSVRESRERAVDDLLAFIAVTGLATMMKPEMADQIPEEFRGKLQRLMSEYDFTQHTIPGGRNVDLMRELGLAEYLGNVDVVAGTAEEVGKTMGRLEALGVDTYFVTLSGHEEPESTMRAMSEIFGKTTKTA